MIGPELRYITKPDKDGINRRLYIVQCPDCGCDRFTQRSRIGQRQRCVDCAAKVSMPQSQRDKISATLRHKYKTDGEFKARVAAAQNVASGDRHWNWKGGITPINQRTRTGEDSNAWKRAVLHRDGYACRLCNSKENLQAHHLNGWAEFPEERYILENGMTLCVPCHTFYHNYEKEARNNGNFCVKR